MILALTLAAALYSTQPVETATQCFRLLYREYQGALAGSAILNEGNDFAMVFNTRGVRVATVKWDLFDMFLTAHKLKAERLACQPRS